MSATAQLENVKYYGVSLEKKNFHSAIWLPEGQP